jgi:hypothetical protein
MTRLQVQSSSSAKADDPVRRGLSIQTLAQTTAEQSMTPSLRGAEGEEAIQNLRAALDCFASLATTVIEHKAPPLSSRSPQAA